MGSPCESCTTLTGWRRVPSLSTALQKNASVVLASLNVLQPFNRSKADNEENYRQLIKEARLEGLRIDRGTKMAARFADSRGLSIGKIIQGYENSAKIFLSMDDSQALQCFLEAIQIYVKHAKIKLAIQNCFEYGYKIERSSFIQQRGEFYDLGDKLRVQHTIFHSCGVRQFTKGYYTDIKRVAQDLTKILCKVIDILGTRLNNLREITEDMDCEVKCDVMVLNMKI
ncbi:hypothetical protein RF11_14487 [Thelohanellus kitauei]|uniref:Uncharacterized protein n=1 Tax=Thelohanellus kitauei TaxID=669202 RepID=A0A0C2NF72_THEKT|nr:hypothetical protein RF11_14487 [Thelohanellus kitauei]